MSTRWFNATHLRLAVISCQHISKDGEGEDSCEHNHRAIRSISPKSAFGRGFMREEMRWTCLQLCNHEPKKKGGNAESRRASWQERDDVGEKCNDGCAATDTEQKLGACLVLLCVWQIAMEPVIATSRVSSHYMAFSRGTE